MNRPDWDSYLMAIAALVSTRSHDPDTKHGAVVVDHHHRILGIGYNGFPRGGDTSGYSTRRPDKYPMIVHAECNAILNCTTRPEGGKLYVTGCPCPRCMQMIIQSGIIAVNYGTRASVMVGDDEKGGVNLLAKNHGVKLMAWIAGCVSVLDSAIAIEVGE